MDSNSVTATQAVEKTEDKFYVEPNIYLYDNLKETLSEAPVEINPFLPSLAHACRV